MHGGAERAQKDGEQQRWDPPLARPPTATGLQQGAAPCRGQHGSVCQLCAAGNGTATHRYGTATRSCTLPWSAWLCVPAVCCWKAPGRLRVGEWQRKSWIICRDSTRQAQCDSCVIVQQTDAEQSTAGPGRSDQGEVESAHEIRHSRRTEHETQHVQQLQEILPACLHRKAHNQPERNTLAIDLLWKNCTADAWWRL